MALETVVYEQDLFSYTKEPFVDLFGGGSGSGSGSGSGGYWPEEGCDFDELATNFHHVFLENSTPSSQQCCSPNASISDLQISNHQEVFHDLDSLMQPQYSNNNVLEMSPRFKRRRSRPRKSLEEIERQRMAHIAVERNRRKQMNEYLSVLSGLMPSGYAQKGDQASIVGGAINYVKELEQLLQFLDGKNHTQNQEAIGSNSSISSSLSPSPSPSPSPSSSVPFSEFFNYPQFSNVSTGSSRNCYGTRNNQSIVVAADIEVTMVENSHASLKIRSKKRPKQLLKLVSGLLAMRLTILHLNVTTSNQTVLYSLNLKVEDDCASNSADEIAATVNQMFIRIQQETAGSTDYNGQH